MEHIKFWKYHISKISDDYYYASTNVDKRHKLISPAPSYFIKFELLDKSNKSNDNYKLIINQSHHKTSPIIIEKSKDSLKISFKPNETLVNNNILNDSNSNSNKSIQYKFDKSPKSIALLDSIQMVNQYQFNQLSVCELKSSTSNLFSKSKVNGVKLGKDGSIYFINNSNSTTAWYDNVYAFFRPCNREISSKLTKSVLKSSKLMSSSSLTNSSGSTAPSSTGSGNANNEADFDDDNDDEDDDEAPNVNYIAYDGLLSRHPIDDSPNDFKFGWLTIYDKDDFFRKPGNWQLVLSVSIGSAIDSNFNKFVNM